MSCDRFSLWQFTRILHQCYRDLIPRCPFCNDTVIAKNARFSFISTSPLAAILYQIGKQHFREKTEPESVSSVNSIGRSRIMPKWIRLLVRGHVVRLLTNSNSKYGGLWSMHIVLVKYQRTHDSGKVVLSQRSFLVWLVGLFLCCIITVCLRSHTGDHYTRLVLYFVIDTQPESRFDFLFFFNRIVFTSVVSPWLLFGVW